MTRKLKIASEVSSESPMKSVSFTDSTTHRLSPSIARRFMLSKGAYQLPISVTIEKHQKGTSKHTILRKKQDKLEITIPVQDGMRSRTSFPVEIISKQSGSKRFIVSVNTTPSRIPRMHKVSVSLYSEGGQDGE